jgi:hypothetical protein
MKYFRRKLFSTTMQDLKKRQENSLEAQAEAEAAILDADNGTV